MANVKISALPLTTITDRNDYLVKNNSGETLTSKVQLKNMLGLTNGTTTDSLKSASFLTPVAAISQGVGSIAIGNDSEAYADYSTALGNRAEVFDSGRVEATALGAFTRVAQYSTAVGNSVQAVGAYSTGMGASVTCNGGSDVSIGRNTSSTGQFSVVLGYNSSSNQTGGVAIGNNADVTAVDSIAIGTNTLASHSQSVAIGNGVSSTFTATTHCNNIHAEGQITTDANTLSNQASYDLNMDLGATWILNLNQDATLNFTEWREGAFYFIIINNGGTFNFTSVTATGGVIRYNGGGRVAITHNSWDVWKINVIGSTLLVEQIANYTT